MSIEYRRATVQGALWYMVFRRLSRPLLLMCFLEDWPEPMADEAKDVSVTGVVVAEAEDGERYDYPMGHVSATTVLPCHVPSLGDPQVTAEKGGGHAVAFDLAPAVTSLMARLIPVASCSSLKGQTSLRCPCSDLPSVA